MLKFLRFEVLSVVFNFFSVGHFLGKGVLVSFDIILMMS
jgi:hypothetical protein